MECISTIHSIIGSVKVLNWVVLIFVPACLIVSTVDPFESYSKCFTKAIFTFKFKQSGQALELWGFLVKLILACNFFIFL